MLGTDVTHSRYSMNVLCSICCAGGLLAQGPASPGKVGEPDSPALAIEARRIQVFEKAAPAVVVLEVDIHPAWPERVPEEEPSQPGRHPESHSEPHGSPRPGLHSEGSGFVVGADGIIVTNRHVIAGARHITVRFQDNRRLAGRLVGEDERSDIAVVRVEARGLPFLEFGDSDALRVGQSVFAIGAPFGQEWSFSSGMLSGKNRTRLLAPSSVLPLYEDYLQTDAFVNSGHSGGPLLDLQGKVIGMNTLIARSDRGLAFAVPSNFLKATVAQIAESGTLRRPWFGFRVETLGESAGLQQRLAAAESGAVVLSIDPESPAMQSDVRPGDVVQTVDGLRVHGSADLQRELFTRAVGRPVKLGIWRSGTTKTLSVTPRALPEKPGAKSESTPSAQDSSPKNAHYGLALRDAKGGGARIETVESGSIAARSEMQAGDLILEVEGRPVKGGTDCFAALASALKRNQGGALLQVDRHGRRVLVLLSGR